MAVISTTEVFTANEQVTPDKLNNIAILSKFVADAISDGTLKLNESGQLSVGVISGDNIASGSITSSKIAAGSITDDKLAFATVPVGGVIALIYFSNTLVEGKYLFADGRVLSRNDHPYLFSKIGTFYGSTDSTNFKIPDLRGLTIKSLGVNVFGRGNGSLLTGQFEDQELLAHSHTQVGGPNNNNAGMVGNGGWYASTTMSSAFSSTTGVSGSGNQNRVDSAILPLYIRVL